MSTKSEGKPFEWLHETTDELAEWLRKNGDLLSLPGGGVAPITASTPGAAREHFSRHQREVIPIRDGAPTYVGVDLAKGVRRSGKRRAMLEQFGSFDEHGAFYADPDKVIQYAGFHADPHGVIQLHQTSLPMGARPSWLRIQSFRDVAPKYVEEHLDCLEAGWVENMCSIDELGTPLYRLSPPLQKRATVSGTPTHVLDPAPDSAKQTW